MESKREQQENNVRRVIKENNIDLSKLFSLDEEAILNFVKSELSDVQRVLTEDSSGSSECQVESAEMSEIDEEKCGAREALLRLVMGVLRNMKQEELAESVEIKIVSSMCRRKLKVSLKGTLQKPAEAESIKPKPSFQSLVNPQLYVTERGTGDVNNKHEVRLIETASRMPGQATPPITCEDIFSSLSGHNIRTLLTKGVAGIGKTILTQKFTLDWVDGKSNQDIHFVFPFTFRELNLLKGKRHSLVGLLNRVFSETEDTGLCSYDNFNVLFIFDGLDECRLSLDFQNNEVWTDITKVTSVDILLTNLIKGNLLPSAHVWMLTRPAAATHIPPECVDMVTELRGFTDPEKEEYFRKKNVDKKLANRIIAYIKASRSFHTMCRSPSFCWISSTVLEHVLTVKKVEMPKTLTDIYIHLLVVQSIHYETYPQWNTDGRKFILALGKLAFEQLKKGNLIFYEADLAQCGVDLKSATVYSTVLPQIFKEECVLNMAKVFSFIHLSIQEFFASLYVFLSHVNTGVNLLAETQSSSKKAAQSRNKSKAKLFYQSAVDKALHSENGHLDMILRFLLGLSLEANQNLLQGLLKRSGTVTGPQTNQKLVQYIKERISEHPSSERTINLFHCLHELKDNSLVEEIQQNLRSGRLSTDTMSPVQWSALVFVLLSSEKDLDLFELKKYSASDETLERLLPVAKVASVCLLSGCGLTERCCQGLASILSCTSSRLLELDLSDNELKDAGIKLLSDGLASPHCKLEVLRLSGCMVTEAGCVALATALTSNPCHLRELDLSYNHPGDSSVALLSAGLNNQHWRLDTLSVAHGGIWRLKSGLKKYVCDLTLDPNTAHRELSLSEDNRKASVVTEKQPYPDHPERFDFWSQVFCREGLTGRCYWEVEWEGEVYIGATYRGIKRRGVGGDCRLGGNDISWSLECLGNTYSAWHNQRKNAVNLPPTTGAHKVGVYLDWAAGWLSFYRVSTKTMTHIHTFRTTFTEPLYPGFWVGFGFCLGSGSSVSLCPIDEVV